MVRQRTLTPSFQGSNPCSPAKWSTSDEVLFSYYEISGSRVFTGFAGLLKFFSETLSIIGQFKMTLLPKGAENRKNEENRLKIDKILLFLPFAQKIMFTFVIFSSHNQDSFHTSSAQIHFSTPTAYSSVRRRTLIDLLGQLYFGVCLTALG